MIFPHPNRQARTNHRTATRWRSLLALCLLTLGSGLAAETLPQDSLITTYYEAIKHGDYRSAAAVIDRPSTTALHQQFIKLLISENAAGHRRLLEALFGPEATLNDAITADPIFFYERLLARAYRNMPKDRRSQIQIRVIGHVREYSDVLHVVYRESIRTGNGLGDTTRTLTVRENRDGWRLKVPYEMWLSLDIARNSMAGYVSDRLERQLLRDRLGSDEAKAE